MPPPGATTRPAAGACAASAGNPRYHRARRRAPAGRETATHTKPGAVLLVRRSSPAPDGRETLAHRLRRLRVDGDDDENGRSCGTSGRRTVQSRGHSREREWLHEADPRASALWAERSCIEVFASSANRASGDQTERCRKSSIDARSGSGESPSIELYGRVLNPVTRTRR